MPTTTLEQSRSEMWQSQGYLTGLEVFPESEMKDYRSQFDALEADQGLGKAEIGLNNMHFTHEFVWRLSTHPPVLEAIRSVLGPDVLLLGNHFFCKYPSASRGDKFVAWHQDVTYWGLEPPRAVTAWLAIDDVDVDNGCMRVIPGSHRHGILTHGNLGDGWKSAQHQPGNPRGELRFESNGGPCAEGRPDVGPRRHAHPRKQPQPLRQTALRSGDPIHFSAGQAGSSQLFGKTLPAGSGLRTRRIRSLPEDSRTLPAGRETRLEKLMTPSDQNAGPAANPGDSVVVLFKGGRLPAWHRSLPKETGCLLTGTCRPDVVGVLVDTG